MKEAIYLDYNNKEQVEWFINRASKLCKMIPLDKIVKRGTGEIVGQCFEPIGLRRKTVIKECTKFLGKTSKVVWEMNVK